MSPTIHFNHHSNNFNTQSLLYLVHTYNNNYNYKQYKTAPFHFHSYFDTIVTLE